MLVLMLYGIFYCDCGSYVFGGFVMGIDYCGWIDVVVFGLGLLLVMIIVEFDVLVMVDCLLFD